MKRSVAVIGPTPQFLRWSIEHPCALRQIDRQRLSDVTFRQLRGVREFSLANTEGRVFENIVVHPAARSSDPESAMGFGEDEVLEVFGGAAEINGCCEDCPANTDAGEENSLWAGCYGWLTADGSTLSNHGFETSGNGSDQGDFLVREVDYAIEMLNLRSLVAANMPLTRPAWYGFWQGGILTVPQLLLLEKILSAALRRHETQADPRFVNDLLRFIDALTLSHRNSLALHVQLVPPGHSDGSQWTMFPYCERCKFSTGPEQTNWTVCPVCEKPGAAHGVRKNKVLGLRPYVNLSRVLGLDQTVEFLKRYESAKADVANQKTGGPS